MRSKVAEQLRQEQVEQIQRMTPSQRVALARKLGERDLRVYMAFQKVDRGNALKAIRHSHQLGRRSSRCMDESLEVNPDRVRRILESLGQYAAIGAIAVAARGAARR